MLIPLTTQLELFFLASVTAESHYLIFKLAQPGIGTLSFSVTSYKLFHKIVVYGHSLVLEKYNHCFKKLWNKKCFKFFYSKIDFILVSSLVVVALVGDAEALFAGPSDLGNVLTKLFLASGVGFAASWRHSLESRVCNGKYDLMWRYDMIWWYDLVWQSQLFRPQEAPGCLALNVAPKLNPFGLTINYTTAQDK